MEKNKKKHNIIFYTLFMILMFIIVAEIISGVGTVLLAQYFNKIVNFNKYGEQMYFEIAVSLTILIVILLSGNIYIFKCKKEKLSTSLKKGWPLYIIMAFTTLPSVIISILEHGIKIDNLITLTIYCAAIGIYEELLCRGWLQNEFIERFGSNKKGVIKSIVISSFIFGLMHITNLSIQSPLETLTQIINAIAMGMVLGSIYYKTQNIWSVIILHAVWDYSILFLDHTLLMDCIYVGSPSINYILTSSLTTILLSVYYIISSIIIMRSENTVKNDKLVFEDNKQTKKKLFIVAAIFLVLTFASALLPTEEKDYKLECYDFGQINIDEYEIHKIVKNKYEIEYNEYKYSFYIENERAIIQNIVTNETLVLPYNNVDIISVIENNGKYLLIINTLDYNVYYSSFININNMANGKDYLIKISESFEEKHFPSSSFYGYITLEEDSYKYPCLITYYNEMYIIDKNGKETIISKN